MVILKEGGMEEDGYTFLRRLMGRYDPGMTVHRMEVDLLGLTTEMAPEEKSGGDAVSVLARCLHGKGWDE